MYVSEPNANEYRNSSVFWFVRLENARGQQDHEAAAEAIRELRRLGVEIRFNPTVGGATHA